MRACMSAGSCHPDLTNTGFVEWDIMVDHFGVPSKVVTYF